MKVYLIRHGETQANIEHRYCGSTDISLAKEGRYKLENIHYRLPENVRYLTSGMKRTNETLNILFGSVSFAAITDFKEINFGIFEMKTYDELKSDAEYLRWISGNNENNVPPNGESGEEFKNRVLKALPELFLNDSVLITHGGVIATIMQFLFPNENKNRYEWQPEPGFGYVIEKNGDQYDYKEIL